MLNRAWDDAYHELWGHAAHHRGLRAATGTPRSGLSREVPLSETATRALAAHMHSRSDDLVFCDEQGRPFTATRMRSELRRICKRAGLRRIGWHVLRHSFASHLVMRGVALAVVQRLMGHSSIVVGIRNDKNPPKRVSVKGLPKFGYRDWRNATRSDFSCLVSPMVNRVL